MRGTFQVSNFFLKPFSTIFFNFFLTGLFNRSGPAPDAQAMPGTWIIKKSGNKSGKNQDIFHCGKNFKIFGSPAQSRPSSSATHARFGCREPLPMILQTRSLSDPATARQSNHKRSKMF
jgi:hypothetical protein